MGPPTVTVEREPTMPNLATLSVSPAADEEPFSFVRPPSYHPVNGVDVPGGDCKRLCIRHQRIAADVHVNDDLQKAIESLTPNNQQAVNTVWRLFSASPSSRRILILRGLLTICCPSQLSFLSAACAQELRFDPFSTLPREISLKILGYLDAFSLGRAAQVCRSWKSLADDDVVWRAMCEQHIERKCTKCGWGLPLMEKKRKARVFLMHSQTAVGAIGRGVPTAPAAQQQQQQQLPPPLPTPLQSAQTAVSYSHSHAHTHSRERSSPSHPPSPHPHNQHPTHPHQPQPQPQPSTSSSGPSASTSDRRIASLPSRTRSVSPASTSGRTGPPALSGPSSPTPSHSSHFHADAHSHSLSSSIASLSPPKEERSEAMDVDDEPAEDDEGRASKRPCSRSHSVAPVEQDGDEHAQSALRRHPAVHRATTSGTNSASTSRPGSPRGFSFSSAFAGSAPTASAPTPGGTSSAAASAHITSWPAAPTTSASHRPASPAASRSSRPTTRPWKTVFCERLAIERNWRRGSYKALTLRGHTDGITCLQVSDSLPHPSFPVIMSGSWDRTIRIWNAATGAEVACLRGHARGVRALQFDGAKLISAGMDSQVRIWDWRAGRTVRVLEGHSDAVTCLKYDRRVLVTGSADAEVRVWNFETGETVVLNGHQEWVNDLVIWSSKADEDGTAGGKRKAADTNANSGGGALASRGPVGVTSRYPGGLASGTTSGTWSGNVASEGELKLLFSASDDGTIKVWNLGTLECLRTLKEHVAQVQKLAIIERDRGEDEQDPDAEMDDPLANTPFPLVDGNVGPTSPVHTRGRLSPSTSRAHAGPSSSAAALRNRSISRSRQEKWGLPASAKMPTLPMVVSGSLDNTIKMWDLESGTGQKTLFGHVEGVWAVDADRLRIVSASHDRTESVEE